MLTFTLLLVAFISLIACIGLRGLRLPDLFPLTTITVSLFDSLSSMFGVVVLFTKGQCLALPSLIHKFDIPGDIQSLNWDLNLD